MDRPDPRKEAKDQEPLMLMALTVLGEARNQSYEGKVAVAQVIRNRMDLKGQTVAEVALAPWQFSCWNAEDPNRLFLEQAIAKAADNVQPLGLWEECVQAAMCALPQPRNGGPPPEREPDPTHGCTHYVTADLKEQPVPKTRKAPWYSSRCVEKGITEFVVQIGAHWFAKTKW